MKTGIFLRSRRLLLSIPDRGGAGQNGGPIKIGIIGLDTSHVPAFTGLFNDPKAEGDLAGFKVVAGFPGGSQDVEVQLHPRRDVHQADSRRSTASRSSTRSTSCLARSMSC